MQVNVALPPKGPAVRIKLEKLRDGEGRRMESASRDTNFQTLETYGRAEKLDPVIGRDDEIRRVVRILSRRTKNNPVPSATASPASARRPWWRASCSTSCVGTFLATFSTCASSRGRAHGRR
jgi:hypothetical protein